MTTLRETNKFRAIAAFLITPWIYTYSLTWLLINPASLHGGTLHGNIGDMMGMVSQPPTISE